jgi:glyoxylase-like metal-dependent hydrolase (beta-lactamase superfamily II)
MTASWITPQEVVPKPVGWKAQDYSMEPANVETLEDGQEFDLGDRMFKVLHIPGHSPGSIALHDVDNGVIATGDTLYQTSHGLIDWYPGSNTTKMQNSVKKLLDMASNKTVNTVLTGHNDVIDCETMVKQGERYIAEHGWNRKIRKGFSRYRANLVLKGNSVMNLPEIFRESISN